ncbi:MAG: sigma-54 dependent transcriptional regulator [Bacteroidales bacterium]|nr:sigma-54 dependent transcriptional regulator [Bacteroidales bacterium]
MKKKGTLLVVDDNRAVLQSVDLLMSAQLEKVITCTNPELIPSLLKEHKLDAVLLDMNFHAGINSGNEGLYWLREIKRLSPNTQVVLFTAYADISLAVNGMKEGAADFVVKPFDNQTMSETLLKAISPKPKDKGRKTKGQNMLWGSSPAMERLRIMVEKVAPTDANILITGENGTGKDLLARELHAQSLRAQGPLEIVDMGAVVDTLFESELYGHVRGAFTDAKTDRIGKFESANEGTIFLDEIANLPLPLQAKLLTVLQQRQVVPVGSNSPRPVNVRLICATNRNLEAMVQEGAFRQDLYYRINSIHLELPPLRQRKADILALANLFIEKYAKQYGKGAPQLSQGAINALTDCQWPGNIRQLQHCIEKAVILSDKPMLTSSDFDLPQNSPALESAGETTLEDMEQRMIAQAIADCQGNMSLVAKRLGITRQTLYNKIKKYNL